MKKVIISIVMALYLTAASQAALTNADVDKIMRYIDANEANDVRVYYVNKSGHDYNGGHSIKKAKLTINAAVTEIAGLDATNYKIIIGPGEYNEQIDTYTSAVAYISFVGSGPSTVLTYANGESGSTLVLSNSCTVENMRIVDTGATSTTKWALTVTGELTPLILKNLEVTSNSGGISFDDQHDAYVVDSFIVAKTIGIGTSAGGAGQDAINIDRCNIDMQNTGGDVIGLDLQCALSSISNTTIGVTGKGDSDERAIAVRYNQTEDKGRNGAHTINNVAIRTDSSLGDYEYGIFLNYALSSGILTAKVNASNCAIKNFGAGDNVYSIAEDHPSTANLVTVNNCIFDKTKTSGNISVFDGNNVWVYARKADANAGLLKNATYGLEKIKKYAAGADANASNIYNVVKSGGTGDANAVWADVKAGSGAADSNYTELLSAIEEVDNHVKAKR